MVLHVYLCSLHDHDLTTRAHRSMTLWKFVLFGACVCPDYARWCEAAERWQPFAGTSV